MFGPALALAACTYDWPAGATATDASMDAPNDASLVDHTDVPDVGPDTSPPPKDAGPDTAPNCPALQAAVVAARPAAKKCTQGVSFCAGKVKDECDCDTYVDDAAAPAVAAYANAAAAYRTSKCPISCGSCSVVTPGCIVNPDAGFATFCMP